VISFLSRYSFSFICILIASLLSKVNSVLVVKLIASGNPYGMAKQKRARPGEGIPAHVKKAEGKALHALWARRKRRTQAAFAADCGYTQGYLGQFFAGLRPLTLDMAQKFAEELDVEIAQFSARLAEEQHAELIASKWPFHAFSREEYLLLTPGQRLAAEGAVLGVLRDSGHLPARKLRVIRSDPR